ncbi:PLC-like phosphodiesterase protein [Rutstroemia sp. NJR-2017a BVV2]|nr:PLC-like phosphodiesterase protein [Rutstroemia sp. NJR-2017a BVV2]
MRSSFLAASAALLSLTSFVQAIPQNGGFGGSGGSSGQSASSVVATSSTASVATVSEAAVSTSTVACNNSPQLCNRNYNNITHMGAHDLAFLRDQSTGFSTSGNQFYNVTVALSAGIRLIQAQVHNENGTLELCHTSCLLLDAGALENFLSEIKTWMDANTNEVVTLLLVNSDNESAAKFGAAFTSSGIDTYGYTPTSTTAPISTWPTLQTLITANTRLITFIASITYDSTYPYLLTEFTYVFETAFGVLSTDAFNCTLDRPSSVSSASAAISSGYMGLVNHFLDEAQSFGITVPDVDNITTTNSPSTSITGALGTQAKQCGSEWGQKPTFILVDFFNVGPSIETADIMNGIVGQTSGRTNVSTSILTASSSSKDTSGAERNLGLGLGSMWLVLGAVALGNCVFF